MAEIKILRRGSVDFVRQIFCLFSVHDTWVILMILSEHLLFFVATSDNLLNLLIEQVL